LPCLFKIILKAARPRNTSIISSQPDKKLAGAGERNLLTRSIDIVDPFEPTIEVKFYRGAKRLCIASAIGAVMLSALDLADIRSVESVTDLIHANSARVADLPNIIRIGIQSIAIAAPSPSASAMIPRGDISIPQQVVRVDDSLMAELSAVRDRDAVEFAMQSPPSWKNAELPVATAPTPAALVFASADLAPLQLPPVTPISLPMSEAIPPDMVPLPRPAPGVPPPSPAELLHLEGKDYAKAERCLANAIYFEARSEPVSGQIAVAQVVMNRTFSGFYPNDVCSVVYQNAHRHLACQFTFACDGKSKAITERGAWARANRIANQTLDGKLYVTAVGASTHYHAIYVHPNWVREMHKNARYGIHNFYRPIAWGNGAEEPVWGPAALALNKKR
jgi:hypothetical protein